MAKETPFFKFDTASWLGGSIQFTSLECKGLFIDLCALYWESEKPIKIDTKFKVRVRCDEGTLSDLKGTLRDLEIIKETKLGISIPFLDKLKDERKIWLKKCSESGKKSAKNKGTSSNKKEERRKKNVESRIEIEEKEEDKKTTFKKPTLEEVIEYFAEKKTHIDPEVFYNHYESVNWFRGKTKLKDWKACLKTWEKNEPKKETYKDGRFIQGFDPNHQWYLWQGKLYNTDGTISQDFEWSDKFGSVISK